MDKLKKSVKYKLQDYPDIQASLIDAVKSGTVVLDNDYDNLNCVLASDYDDKIKVLALKVKQAKIRSRLLKHKCIIVPFIGVENFTKVVSYLRDSNCSANELQTYIRGLVADTVLDDDISEIINLIY